MIPTNQAATATLRAENREREFQAHLDSTVAYNAAIYEAGDVPWHDGDAEARRLLYMHRFERPEPPANLNPIKSIRSYQKRDNAHEATAIGSEIPCAGDQPHAA